jgi:AcrR family transcriptional regulator
MPRRKLLSDVAVLEAAMRVITRLGPGDVTLNDIASEAGIAPATLMQRFGDKRGLILKAIEHENLRLAALIETLPRGAGAASVLALFRLLTPDLADADALADPLSWLRTDMGDPRIGALARERLALVRRAVAVRLPPLALTPDEAAWLVMAQWQGALAQWGIERRGGLVDYMTASLAAWFALVRR